MAPRTGLKPFTGELLTCRNCARLSAQTRPSLTSALSLLPHIQTRHATLLRRPHRPYTFTQLLTLSDGSTFVHRTTSPLPVYRSNRDTRNTPLWNPSNQKMANVEEDEAGRLRAFRRRFGRGWDAELEPEVLGQAGVDVQDESEKVETESTKEVKKARAQVAEDIDGTDGWSDGREDNLLDLISSYGLKAEKSETAKSSLQSAKNSGKGKGGQR